MRDKSKDDTLFNCNQEHEIDYVVSQCVTKCPSLDRDKVKKFIIDKCNDKTIYHSTHKYVYNLISTHFKVDLD